jgi:tetratricopeptide (TPR) repeat protein
MKKAFLFILAVVVATMYAGAQKKMIRTAEDALEKKELDKAWESIQAAKNNVETKDNPKTYFVMGEILQELSKTTTDAKYAAISDDPIVEAFKSYEKCLEMDPKRRFESDIAKQLLDITGTAGLNKDLSTIAANKAFNEYDKKNFSKAFDKFELVLKIRQYTILKAIPDTLMIFNSGLAAVNAKKYDEAVSYLKKAIDMKYNGGTTYSWLRSAYMLKGDTAQAIATMQKAYEVYPNDLSVLVDLVNFYLINGQVTQAFDYLNKAKEKDPNNVSFIFAEGTLYEKMNRPDKAIESYNKAIAVDSTYFNAYYNIGVIYHNKAKAIYDSAVNENDTKKYNELVIKADQELKNSLPPLEKAHRVDVKETLTAETLESIYFRLQMYDRLLKISEEMHQYYPKDLAHAKMLKNAYLNLKMDDKLKQLNTEMGW